MAYHINRIVGHTMLGLVIAVAMGSMDRSVRAAGPATQPAAAAKTDAKPKVKPVDLKKIAAQFQVYPQSINLSSSINFDENGHVQRKYHQFSMSLIVRYPGKIRAQRYSANIDKVVTDAGEVLQIDPNQQRNNSRIYHNPNNRNATQSFGIGLNLPMPSRATEKIKEISGKLSVTVAVGPEREVVLGPIKKFDGKQIHINNFPDSVIRVDRQGSRVKVSVNRSLSTLLGRVVFYDANGREKRSSGWGNGSSGSDMVYSNYNVNLKDGDKVVLRFFSQSKKIEIPFSIHDVELPLMRGGAPRVDLALNAELVGKHPIKLGRTTHPHEQPGRTTGEPVQLGITIDN